MDAQEATAGPVATAVTARWRPLEKIDRRVVGVLVEKAKTTPEQYPLTVNSLVNGCNQKNNRDPNMQLEEADVMESLDRLKMAGAAAEVQGSGRVPKFRHLLYEWMGVDKVELAVMGELLLRGAQTEGELRGRASRMEPIADLNAPRGILQSLRGKRLVIDITPPGRGQIISHNLYEPEELERLKERLGGEGSPEAGHAEPPRERAARQARMEPAGGEDLRSLREEVTQLRREVQSLAETVRQQQNAINALGPSSNG